MREPPEIPKFNEDPKAFFAYYGAIGGRAKSAAKKNAAKLNAFKKGKKRGPKTKRKDASDQTKGLVNYLRRRNVAK